MNLLDIQSPLSKTKLFLKNSITSHNKRLGIPTNYPNVKN
jgi:hypothetical protein